MQNNVLQLVKSSIGTILILIAGHSITVSSVIAQPPSPFENCTVNLLNRTAQVQADGSYTIFNVPADQGIFRVRMVCPDGTTTLQGQSAFSAPVENGTTIIGGISLGLVPQIPTSISLTTPSPALNNISATTQLTVTGTFPDTSTQDLTAQSTGTTYVSSNPSIATVSPEGLVTALSSGTAMISASSDGTLTAIAITVSLTADNDGDGLPNDYEAANGLDPNNPADAAQDPDGDGLSNLEEFNRGTVPFVTDTDGDGLNDGDEIPLGTNPTNADSDLDGLSDGDEIRLGSNPLNSDSDGDGLPDGVEVALGGHPVNTNPFADIDGDGLTNLDEIDISTDPGNLDTDGDELTDGEEVLAGTNPLIPDATPPVITLTNPTVGRVRIEGEMILLTADASDDGRVTRVEFSANGIVVGTDKTAPYQAVFIFPNDVTTIAFSATAVDTNNNQATTPEIIINLIPDPLTTVVGHVIDRSRNPVSGVRVTCLEGAGLTDLVGAFSIPGLPTTQGDISCSITSGPQEGTIFTGDSNATFPVRGGTTDVGTLIATPAPSMFLVPPRLSVGGASSVVADLNGDGLLDLVNAPGSSRYVSVFLGNGDSTFQSEARFPADASQSLVVSDLNGDGLIDLVTSNGSLVGNGDGTFQSEVRFPVGSTHARFVVVENLNGDNFPDLGLLHQNSQDVSVLLGKGDGTFDFPTQFLSGRSPVSAAVSDINHDGVSDLVVVNGFSGGTSVFMGNGDGTFQARLVLPGSPYIVQVADMNGDSFPDIIAANKFPSRDLSLHLGNGDGTFQSPASLLSIFDPRTLTVMDINKDGFRDVVVTTDGDDMILLGIGDGTFQAPARFFIGSVVSSLAVADLNGDLFLDLVATGLGDLSILLGKRGGTFRTPSHIPVGKRPRFVEVSDLNGDNHPDIVTVTVPLGGSADVSVLLGSESGTFQEKARYSIGDRPSDMLLSDLNGDNILDIVAADENAHDVSISLGNGDGTFEPEIRFPFGGVPDSVVAADLNGDSRIDLVTSIRNGFSKALSVLFGNGDGSFQTAQRIAVFAFEFDVADLNGDNIPDLIAHVTRPSPSHVSVLFGNGDGTFQPEQNIFSPDPSTAVTALAVADLNGDSRADLVVLDADGDKVSVLLGNGDGTFQSTLHFTAGKIYNFVTVADLDGDNLPDLVFTDSRNSSSDDVSLLLGNGDGTFQSPLRFLMGPSVRRVLAADFNGDNLLDLVSPLVSSDNISVLFNTNPFNIDP